MDLVNAGSNFMEGIAAKNHVIPRKSKINDAQLPALRSHLVSEEWDSSSVSWMWITLLEPTTEGESKMKLVWLNEKGDEIDSISFKGDDEFYFTALLSGPQYMLELKLRNFDFVWRDKPDPKYEIGGLKWLNTLSKLFLPMVIRPLRGLRHLKSARKQLIDGCDTRKWNRYLWGLAMTKSFEEARKCMMAHPWWAFPPCMTCVYKYDCPYGLTDPWSKERGWYYREKGDFDEEMGY